MRKQLRGVFVALVISSLYVTSASAAPAPSLFGRAKQFVMKVIGLSRLSPPVGTPAPEEPDSTTTTRTSKSES